VSNDQLPIFDSNGQVIDLKQDEKELARLIWHNGLKSVDDYARIKAQLPFQHFAIQVAQDLERAGILYTGTKLEFEPYHQGEWQAKVDYHQLIQSNFTLLKIVRETAWADFYQQITVFSYRPALRTSKPWGPTHKFDTRTGQIVEHKGKRKVKPPESYDKTKKQAATFLSKHLHTPVFGREVQSGGFLFDERECDIRAMYKYDRATFCREWVGSKSQVEAYKESLKSAGTFFTKSERDKFREFVDTETARLNEVLAKFSKASFLGVLIAVDMPESRAIARRRHAELKKAYNTDYPIFFYDNQNKTIRIYTKLEQEKDEYGYDPIAPGAITAALLSAIQKGDHALFKVLLDRGADLTEALRLAVDRKDIELVNECLNRGAVLTSNALTSNSIFLLATEQGHLAFIKVLLAQGLDVNTKRADGSTALILAIQKGYHEIVDVLLENNADVTAKLANGNNALVFAIEKGDLKLVEMLLKKVVDVNAQFDSGDTLLTLAVRNGHHAIVKLLMEKNVDVTIAARGQTVYTLAKDDEMRRLLNQNQNKTKSQKNIDDEFSSMQNKPSTDIAAWLVMREQQANVPDEVKKFINEIDFDKHFEIVKNKWLELDKNAKLNLDYKPGAKAAKTLILDLAKAKSVLCLPGVSLKQGSKKFIDDCIAALKAAEPELKKFRKWNKLIKVFLSIFTKTDSVSKLGMFNQELLKKQKELEAAEKTVVKGM